MLNELADITDEIHEMFSGFGALFKQRTLQKELKDESKLRKGDNVPKYLLGNSSGFFFGMKFGQAVIKSLKQGGHVLIIGSTGTHKTTAGGNPTLEICEDVMIVIDLNGTSAEFYAALEKPKRPYKVLNLMSDRGCIVRYDPFHMIHQGGEENELLLLRELALSIIPLPPNTSEPFWIQSAQNILTGALVYYYNLEDVKFIDAMISIQSTAFDVLIGNICENKTASMYVNQFTGIENLMESKMVAGVRAELSNHIIPFVTDSQIVETFTPTDNPSAENSIVWDNIETHNIFIAVNEGEIEQKSSAIRLILTQLTRYLERRPDKHSPEGKLLTPILIMCDEFPRYGKLESIESAVATLRKRNVTIAIFIQGIEQLEKYYGKLGSRIIMNNSAYQAVLGVFDLETQQYLSERIGSINVIQRGYGEGYNSKFAEPQTYRTQVSESHELIYQPHELARLGNKMILITPDGFCKLVKAPCYPKSKLTEEKNDDEN